MSDAWIPIADYSIKHKVSISTLRRRIKANDIKFRFEDGKYLILDAPAETYMRAHRPSQTSDHAYVMSPAVATHSGMADLRFVETPPPEAPEPLIASPPLAKTHFPFLQAETARLNAGQDVVQGLLSEIKKAYALILAEKEEQILQLKEEVNDLKTLTRILETELNRSRGY